MNAHEAFVILSPRLALRPVGADAVRAIVSGERLGDWADDFPSEGDVFIARGIDRRDGPVPAGEGVGVFGHFQVVERERELVVGGIGFRGRPDRGEAEVGYGIVQSCRGRGYATEALVAICGAAFSDRELAAVVATTDPENLGSQRVLEKAGFTPSEQARDSGLLSYRLVRPT